MNFEQNNRFVLNYNTMYINLYCYSVQIYVSCILFVDCINDIWLNYYCKEKEITFT